MKTKKGSGARELIDTGRNKSFARRDGNGQFTQMIDQGRSLSADAKQHAKTKKPPKQGDKGD
jgi:hypothetical protein